MGGIPKPIDSFISIKVRKTMSEILGLFMIATAAMIVWIALMCLSGSESRVVVVQSGSMEPTFNKGDILFLQLSRDPIRNGEIVVFYTDGREIPVIHRVIKVHQRRMTEEVEVVTKGDSKYGDDRSHYAQGHLMLKQHDVIGRAIGIIPYIGWVNIIMSEKPYIKYLLLGALGLLVLTSKD